MGKGRLSKESIAYILANPTMSLADLAKHVGKTEQAVKKVLDGAAKPSTPTTNEDCVAPSQRHTLANAGKIVDNRTGQAAGAVMTKELSELSDAVAKNETKYSQAVYKPLG